MSYIDFATDGLIIIYKSTVIHTTDTDWVESTQIRGH